MKKIIYVFFILTVVFTSVGCNKDLLEHLSPISVVLNKSEISMIIGESDRLIAKVNPDNKSGTLISWFSEDETIARVDADGLITGLKEGETKIFATVDGHQNYCKVTITKPVVAVSNIELNTTEILLEKDEEYQLVATVNPINATDPTVTWESSDPTGVSVDGQGKIKALQYGVVVSITAKSGGKTAVCAVTVEPKYVDYPSTSYRLSPDGKRLEEWLGAEAHINMNVDTKLKSVEWINNVAFLNNSTVQSIVIGNEVKGVGSWAFAATPALSIVTLPDGFETIGSFAFELSGLQSISFPSSLKTIEAGAFKSSKLISVTVPETVVNFDALDTFRECANLEYLKLPNSVTSIRATVYQCPKLETLILGNAITSFSDWSIDGCVSLRNVELATTVPPAANSNVFSSIPLHLVTLKVPAGSKAAYVATSYVWSSFTNIEEKGF